MWAELPEHERLMRGHRTGHQHADPLVADLPAMAVGAVQHVVAPPGGETGDLGEHVTQTGRDQEPPGGHRSLADLDAEAIALASYGGHHASLDPPSVSGDLGVAYRLDVCWRGAVAGEKVVDMFCRCVARVTRVYDQHRSA